MRQPETSSPLRDHELAERLEAVSRVRAAAVAGLREHFKLDGLVELRVPVIVGLPGACENIASLVPIDSERGSILIQTGQLALERSLAGLNGVWCQTGSYRQDNVDERHLLDFELLEEELTSAHPLAAGASSSEQMFAVLLSRIESAIKAMIRSIVGEASSSVAALGGDVAGLEGLLQREFPIISYGSALDVLTRQGFDVRFGDDLSTAHEAAIVEYTAAGASGSMPVLVTHYPTKIKYFNMKADPEYPSVVYSTDLLLPIAGEAVGGALREEDYGLMRARFDESMQPALARFWPERLISELFEPYFDLVRSGSIPPHAGYGIGLERFLQFVVREPDIRLVSLAHLLRF
jgi:asparaginyl-tRNA synthetase